MTRSDLVARILVAVIPQCDTSKQAVACAAEIADVAIKSGAVNVTDTPDLGASDIEQAIEHLRKARAAFVAVGRENDAASVLEAIHKVEGLRLEIGQ